SPLATRRRLGSRITTAGRPADRIDLDLDAPAALGLGDLLELHSRGGERVVVADDRRELEGDGLCGRGAGLNQHGGGEERDEALHRGLHGESEPSPLYARLGHISSRKDSI